MKKYINIDAAGRGSLRAIFRVSDVTLWQALNYKKDTTLCRKIRKAALENGGRVMVVIDATRDCPKSVNDIQAFARAL